MATRTEQVDIEFRAKLAQLKAELGNLPNQSKKATSAIVSDWRRQWKAAEKEGTTAIDRVASEANKLGKIGSTIGGPFGEALQLIGDGSEIASDGLGRTAKAALGIGAGVAVVGALGVAVFNVLDDLDAYKERLDSLQGRGIVTAEDVANMRRASAAIDEAKGRLSDMAVIVAAKVAPAVEGFVLGAVYSFNWLSTIAGETVHDVVEGLQSMANVWASGFDSKAIARYKVALDDLSSGSFELELAQVTATEAARELYNQIGLTAERDDEATDTHVRNAGRRVAAAKREGEELGKVIQLEELRAERQARLDAQMSAIREAKAERDAELSRAAIDSVLAELDIEVEGARLRMELAEDEQRRRDDAVQSRARAASDWISVTGAAVDTITTLVSGLYDRQVAAAEEGSEAQRKALKRQFAAQKAAAITQATINAALAISNVWAQWAGNPIVAGVLTGVAAAAGAVQIGLIAAQKPQFHSGGGVGRSGPNAPDEIDARLRAGEGVLTPAGMRALEALNRGPSTARGGGMGGGVVVPVYGHRAFDAIVTGSVSRRESSLARALRKARPARAGHRAA